MRGVTHNKVYKQIKAVLEESRLSAYRAVNSRMVLAYWHIGKIIVEHEQSGEAKALYGKGLLKALSDRLTRDYGKGFTETNLKYFRQFYLTFPPFQKSHALRDESSTKVKPQKSHAVRDESGKAAKKKGDKQEAPSQPVQLRWELSWTHYRLLMKLENEQARNYYIEETISQNWSTRALERQINSFYYERIVSTKKKRAIAAEAKTQTKALGATPEDFIKDPYVLEFLHLPSDKGFLEKDLESAIIYKLQMFLLELGKGFSFVTQQKRISAGEEHFFVDLVFYNYILKCFVLFELKLGKLTHQDIGQMDLYVRWFEENIKTATDNPTIGIILCSEKNETIVKYSVLKGSKQLFASKYRLYLPTEEQLANEVQAEMLHYKLEHAK